MNIICLAVRGRYRAASGYLEPLGQVSAGLPQALAHARALPGRVLVLAGIQALVLGLKLFHPRGQFSDVPRNFR